MRYLQVTKQTMMVLAIIVPSSDAVPGVTIVDRTGLKTGTLYPILRRLEQAGWVWPTVGRNGGKMYEMTPLGKTYARQEALEWRKLTESIA